MTAEQIALLSSVLTFAAGGIGWMIKRQAQKQDEVEQAAKEREKQDQAERIAHAPELQRIVADQVESLMSAQSRRIEDLITENQEQRRRHGEDRRSWEAERKTEREEWQRQILEWEKERRQWERERDRYRQIIDELRKELAPYRRDTGSRTRKGDE